MNPDSELYLEALSLPENVGAMVGEARAWMEQILRSAVQDVFLSRDQHGGYTLVAFWKWGIAQTYLLPDLLVDENETFHVVPLSQQIFSVTFSRAPSGPETLSLTMSYITGGSTCLQAEAGACEHLRKMFVTYILPHCKSAVVRYRKPEDEEEDHDGDE